jgi:hypothetical protein
MARVRNEIEAQPRVENGAAAADPIEQVRDLLFGASKRATEDNLHAIEEKIEAMRADFLSRVASLESRLVDLARDTERDQAASIEAIGGAIAQLGATIQNMSAHKKGG